MAQGKVILYDVLKVKLKEQKILVDVDSVNKYIIMYDVFQDYNKQPTSLTYCLGYFDLQDLLYREFSINISEYRIFTCTKEEDFYQEYFYIRDTFGSVDKETLYRLPKIYFDYFGNKIALN